MTPDQRHLTFYYRTGCHLCEDMWQQLQELQVEWQFVLNPVDVDTDNALSARFGRLVPVLAAGDDVLCSYYLDPVALDRFLKRSRGAV